MVKLGDALKRAVEIKPESPEATDERIRLSSVLMHPNRRRMFQFLCLHPCSCITDMTTGLSLSRATITWHLKVLVDADYVEAYRSKNRHFFCPKNMIPRGEAMNIAAVLRNPLSGRVLNEIIGQPGSDVKDLGLAIQGRSPFTGILRELEQVGLIISVKDGRHLRYYPSGKLEKLRTKETKMMRMFQRSLIQRLEREQLQPEISEIKGEGLVISIRFLGQVEDIRMPYNPIGTLLAGR